MQTLSEIRQLLASRGLRPNKRLGQNFLHDHNQLTKLVDAAGVRPGDLVLEVGPGTGTLTETLLEAGARVVACEIDENMVGILEDRVLPRFSDRFTLVHADCLASKHALNEALLSHLDGPFRLIANLPYQVASPLMINLLVHHAPSAANSTQHPGPCLGIFVTIQKEVAERITAAPGSKTFGPLGVLCRSLAKLQIIATLRPTCFWPAPKVTSSMVGIVPHIEHGIDDLPRYAGFVQRLFAHRRKQLGTVLGPSVSEWPDGVSPTQRPEQLSVEQIRQLAELAG